MKFGFMKNEHIVPLNGLNLIMYLAVVKYSSYFVKNVKSNSELKLDVITLPLYKYLSFKDLVFKTCVSDITISPISLSWLLFNPKIFSFISCIIYYTQCLGYKLYLKRNINNLNKS